MLSKTLHWGKMGCHGPKFPKFPSTATPASGSAHSAPPPFGSYPPRIFGIAITGNEVGEKLQDLEDLAFIYDQEGGEVRA